MRFFTDLGNTNVCLPYIASIFLVGNLPMHSLTIHLRLMLQLTIQLRYGAKAVHLNCCKRQTSETNLSTTPFQNHQKFHTLPFPRFPELLATKTGGPKWKKFCRNRVSWIILFLKTNLHLSGNHLLLVADLAHRIHQRIPHLPANLLESKFSPSKPAFLLGMTHRLGETRFDEIRGCHRTTVSGDLHQPKRFLVDIFPAWRRMVRAWF